MQIDYATAGGGAAFDFVQTVKRWADAYDDGLIHATELIKHLDGAVAESILSIAELHDALLLVVETMEMTGCEDDAPLQLNDCRAALAVVRRRHRALMH